MSASLDRASTMTELVRRLHFSPKRPLDLEAAILDVATAVEDLGALQTAVALGTSAGKPPALGMAGQRGGRKPLEKALEAAGLALRESKKQFSVEVGGGERATRLRARLGRVGVNVEALRDRLTRGEGLTIEIPTLTVPLPLSPQTWNRIVFEREVPALQLFLAILSDPGARLLYHGLMALDAETRRWLATQGELLRHLSHDEEAARAFALFGAAIKIAGRRVAVPGGPGGARRWSALLDADVARPDQFVTRLFDKDAGRVAGLYFTVASVEEPRQAFILGTAEPAKDGDERFRLLASSFANCYPASATTYPFSLRSYDAALLLMEVALTPTGTLAGPKWRKFWSRALSGDALPDAPADDLRALAEDGPVDAAWLVDTLCDSAWIDRGLFFETILFGHRVFSHTPDNELPDALVALRARRLYPSVMMAAEQAGLKSRRTYAVLARHAEQIGRVDDPALAITAAQQFQGALALTVGAMAAETLTIETGGRLLESLASLTLSDERYNGRLAGWLAREWLPAVRPHVSIASPATPANAERTLVDALAGPAADASRPILWEGLRYVLDFASTTRDRLLMVRKRQGGVTLDNVLALERIANALQQTGLTLPNVGLLRNELAALAPLLVLPKIAEEFATDALDVSDRIGRALRDLEKIDEARHVKRASEVGQDLAGSIDFLLGHVLASWAYAPHVGEADGPMMVGGDPSIRHDFGIRLVGRLKWRKRWDVALHGGGGASVSGALIGLEAALARWSLRRLAADTVPAVPTIGGNDILSFFLTAALSNPRRLTDDDRDRIARASAAGAAAIDRARQDPAALDRVAATAAMSPWSRQVLSWMVTEESDRIQEKFSAADTARVGGLVSPALDAWGTASLLSGCLCVQMPLARVPELVVGRTADGLIAAQSADLMLRIATILAELKLPAPLASSVMAYAMRDFLDHVTPAHGADFDAYVRQARALDRRTVEDYLGAIAAVGPLRPATPERQ